jgi:hypothetical protein
MTDSINTGQPVRPRPGIRLIHLLGVLAVLGLIAAGVGALTTPEMVFPTLMVLCFALVGGLRLRQHRHQTKVAAAIYAQHGIQVPQSAFNDILHDRDALITVDGRRYRIETSDSLPNHPVSPAVVLITPMGADAASVFGPHH